MYKFGLGLMSVLLITYNTCRAQSDIFNKLSTIPTASPQAASLGKYVEVPVSYFNGLADISIPIYEAKSGDISAPITLKYHPSGIKVSEEGSWIGLGWALDVGGVISHDVKGFDDDDPSYYHMAGKMSFPEQGNTYFDDYYANQNRLGLCTGNVYYDTTKNTGPIAGEPTYNLFINGSLATFNDMETYFLSNNTTDVEPDLYVYNFGKYSGKFFRTGTVINDISKENIQFSFSNTTVITAVTPDGNTYAFGQVEESRNASINSTYPNVKTAYYLTTITSALGKRVTFNYKTFKDLYGSSPGTWFEMAPGSTGIYYGDLVMQMPALSENYIASAHPAIGTKLVQTFSTTYTKAAYLDRIDFDNGYVQFTVSPRQDMYGAKLKEIGIYKTDGTKLKSYVFDYDYFVGNSSFGDYFNLTTACNTYCNDIQGQRTPYPESFRSKRLKLKGLTEKGRNNETGKNYSFGYYEGNNGQTLPYKSSFSQDYWGYYNGATNTTLVPDFRRYNYSYLDNIKNYLATTQLIQQWTGANREPDATKIKEGTLKSISYPTGGTSGFEYEIHSFYNENTQTANVLTVIGPLFDYGSGSQSTSFTLTESTWVQIDGFLFCNCSANNCTTYPSDCGSIAGDANSLYAWIRKDNGTNTPTQYQELQWTLANTPTSGTFSYGILLGAGTYIVEANYPDNRAAGSQANRAAEISVRYYVSSTPGANMAKTGGGLRVSKVTQYDPIEDKTIQKTYTYEGGTMMRFPIFYWQRVEAYADESTTGFTPYPVNYLYSNPVVPYSFSANGSLVGYQRVTETLSDGNTGKSVYEYYVKADLLDYKVNYVTYLSGPGQTSGIPLIAPGAWYIPGVPATTHLKNGLLTRSTAYDKNNIPVKTTFNNYIACNASSFWTFKWDNANPPWGTPSSVFCTYIDVCSYPILIGKIVLDNSVERDYGTSAYVEKNSAYQYNPYCYTQEEDVFNTDKTNGINTKTTYTYATDYTGPDITQTNTANSWLWKMQQPDRNMIAIPIETYTKVNDNNAVTGGTFVEYKDVSGLLVPNKVYQVETATPSAAIVSTAPDNIKPAEMNLIGTIEHDANGNITTTQSKNNVVQAYLWGYGQTLPVAKAENATTDKIAYTSFETANDKGNWNYTPSPYADKVTGTQCHNGGTVSSNGLPAGVYEVSCWYKGTGSPAVANSVLKTSRAGTGGWTYYQWEISVTAGQTVTADPAGGKIDELRLYPANTQMTTYTYDPLTGMTSSTDENNVVSYYEYDGLGRLSTIKDYQGNIVKYYSYNYAK